MTDKLNKEKRDIRLVFSIITGISGLIAYRFYPSVPSLVFWGLCLIFMCIVILSPLMLRPFFLVWLRLGRLIGKVNTQIILFFVFALIFIPAGLLMRLLGKDPMKRQRMDGRESYWEQYGFEGIKDRSRYERQF